MIRTILCSAFRRAQSALRDAVWDIIKLPIAFAPETGRNLGFSFGAIDKPMYAVIYYSVSLECLKS